MKLVIDEKLKHRLVGVSVILSLSAIFLPAMMKKSSQRLENNFSVNVKLPSKPTAPKIVVTNEKEMFKTIKVATVKIPPPPEKKAIDLVKEDFIQSAPVASDVAVPVAKVDPAPEAAAVAKPIEIALSNAAKNVIKRQTNPASVKLEQPTVKMKEKVIKKPVVVKKADNRTSLNKKGVYAVQLASFSKLANAQSLVDTLHRKGYKANYIKTSTRNGVIYKVYAGHSPVKNDVMKLKTQLASTMQLNGFVINTGVS